MAHNDTPESRTSSPSLSERVRSITALRARFSSASRTTLVDDHDTEPVTADESDHIPGTVERHRSVHAAYSGDNVLDQLRQSRSLGDRINMIDQIAGNTGSYPVSILQSIWGSVRDMYCEGARVEARRACFGLASAIARLRDMPEEVQKLLYEVIVEPVSSDLLEDQVRSLKMLTKKGARTELFSPDIGRFLATSLKHHFDLMLGIRKQNANQSSRDPAFLSRERGLSGLFSLIANIEKQSLPSIRDEEQHMLLQEIFTVAEKTVSRRDMRAVVTVLEPIVRMSRIPSDLRGRCVHVLCAICHAVQDVREEAKALLFSFLRSEHKDDVVRILLDLLSLALNERHTSIVCGALNNLLELIRNNGRNGLALVTFGQFIEHVSHVHYGGRPTRSACLRTISSLLTDGVLQKDILESDWKFMIDTILTATGDEIYVPGQRQPLRIERRTETETRPRPHNAETHNERPRNFVEDISNFLQQIASSFNSLWCFLNHTQKNLVARFYSELVDVLPQEHLLQLIDQILSSEIDRTVDLEIPNLMMPEEEENLRTTYAKSMDDVLDLFVFGSRMPPVPYRRVMTALRWDLNESAKQMNIERVTKLADAVNRLLHELHISQGGGLQKAVDLAKTIAVAWGLRKPDDFPAALKLMTPLLYAEATNEDRETIQPADPSLSSAQHGMANVTLALVTVFLGYLPNYTHATTLLFDKFLEVATDKKLSANVRLPALRLLARIRCDQNRAILITPDADSLKLAPYLRRTEDTRYQLATFQRPNTVAIVPANAKPVPVQPLRMYSSGPGLPKDPPPFPSSQAFVRNTHGSGTIDMSKWLSVVLDILRHETDWEIYSYVIVHLPSQLANSSLFAASFAQIKELRSLLVGQLLNGKFFLPPAETHVKQGDVAFCLLQTLIILLGWAEKDKELLMGEQAENPINYFLRHEEEELLSVFLHGIGPWERTGQICVQALTVACHAIPLSISRTIGAILQKLERYITTTHLTMDILELLGTIAMMPSIHTGIMEDDHRKVFAICIKYLEDAREQRSKLALASDASRDYASLARRRTLPATSQSATTLTEPRDQDDRQKDLPQYVFVLVYHVITNWFLALKLRERSKHVGWISSKLAWTDAKGIERIEEQSQATLDMMLRSAYSDLGESQPANPFVEADGEIVKKTWLVGLSIITLETALKTGTTHVTKRQISGTTYATYIHNTTPLAEHHVAIQKDQDDIDVNVFPQHMFLQLTTSISPVPSPLEPICLPDGDVLIEKALSSFDRLDTVDGYSVSVVYVRDEQSTEQEILSNCTHSTRFRRFMEGMGTKVALRGARFNTHGLDKESDLDGPYTYAWRDRLVEIVYHIPSMMPNLEHDLHCTNKKRHIGNNYVTIVWNESGRPYDFDTIPSQFHSISIVITPENSIAPSSSSGGLYTAPRESETADEDNPRYKVETTTHSAYPRLSACASAKLLPLKSLPAFVRQVALNGAIFSNVWTFRESGEYVSSWRSRLREIVRLRKRYTNPTVVATKLESSGTSRQRAYNQGDLFKGKVEMGGIAEVDGVQGALDFSRWAGSIPLGSRPRTSSEVEMRTQGTGQGN